MSLNESIVEDAALEWDSGSNGTGASAWQFLIIISCFSTISD
jgi:hypothetical protein